MDPEEAKRRLEIKPPPYVLLPTLHTAIMLGVGWAIAHETNPVWIALLSAAAASGVFSARLMMRIGFETGAIEAFRRSREMFREIMMERLGES